LGESPYAFGAPVYKGILIHREFWGRGPSFKWGTVGEKLYDTLQARYGDYSKVTARAWKYVNTATYFQGMPVQIGFKIANGEKNVTVKALLGLMPSEFELAMFLKPGSVSWFPEENKYTILLSSSQAEALNIDIEDLPAKVTLEGMPVTVIGIVEDEFGVFKDLDGEPITPLKLDYPPDVENPWNEHLDLRSVLIAHYDLVRQMGGQVVSITIRSDDEEWIRSVAKEIQRELPRLSVYACIGDRVLRFAIQMVMLAGGWEYQMIPIILGGLVIMNQILAGVHTRKRLIGTLGALGLSPRQISFVFLGECISYAVVGGVLGYIGSLLFTTFVPIMMPSMLLSKNYGSSWVMIAWLVTLLLVLIPSVYPLLLSSRLVTPSLERRWRPTSRPVGDEWSIPLPFVTTTRREAIGAIEYLKEYMNAHTSRDATVFRVAEITDDRGELDGLPYYGLLGQLALEPYDLGITQRFKVFFLEEMPERLSLHVMVRRMHGSRDEWVRRNINFLDEIRRQMLMWRILSPGEKEEYSRRAERYE